MSFGADLDERIKLLRGIWLFSTCTDDELGRIAAMFQSSGMAASATLARGHVRLAEGAHADARREFEAAVQQWSGIGAPHETALARLGLGHALRAEGQEERALLEIQAAATTFERIGAISQAARAREGATWTPATVQ